MHKELNTIRLIRDYMVSKGDAPFNTDNIDSIYNVFKTVETKKNFNSLYILNYIHAYISSNEVAKRKTSSRVFEDLLAIIFNGEITDEIHRENDMSDVPYHFENVRDKIASNKREKIDILFNGSYGVSVKTLVEKNLEINLGSFEKSVLYDGMNVRDYLTERQSYNNEKIGLGSRKQLLNLFKFLQEKNLYQKFSQKFIQMYEYIFSDDMILGIKNNNTLTLYFFKGSEFTDLVVSRANNPIQLLEVVNRWEGNSIRIDRKKLLESASRKVELNFDVLNKSVINDINKFDTRLHKTYVDYINSNNDSTHLKLDLIKDLDNLFSIFDNDMGLK